MDGLHAAAAHLLCWTNSAAAIWTGEARKLTSGWCSPVRSWTATWLFAPSCSNSKKKHDDVQPLAARSAAEFVLHVIGLGGWMQVEAASAAARQERRPSYQAQTHVGVNRGSDLELLTGALFLFLRPERTVHIHAGLALGGSSLLAPTMPIMKAPPESGAFCYQSARITTSEFLEQLLFIP